MFSADDKHLKEDAFRAVKDLRSMVEDAGRSWQREFDDLKYAVVGLERLLF